MKYLRKVGARVIRYPALILEGIAVFGVVTGVVVTFFLRAMFYGHDDAKDWAMKWVRKALGLC